MSKGPFETILVGWDESLAAEDALAVAATIAASTGSAVSLAHVTDPGVTPAAGLASTAVERGADLIVIGPSSRNGFRAATFGSVAEHLLHGSPCPVVVAPAGAARTHHEGIHTIGVAFDGSAEAWAALRTAESLALAAGAAIRIIGVLEPVAAVTGGMSGFYGYAEPRDVPRRRLEEMLDDAADSLDSAVRALPVVATGLPAEEILARTEVIDLLVIGSRSQGPLRRVLLGSTSTRVTRAAACPVLVVPRTAVPVAPRAAALAAAAFA